MNNKGKRPISPGKREVMMKQIEEERSALKEKTDIAEAERLAITSQLEEREAALNKAQYVMHYALSLIYSRDWITGL